ncbi:MULTISPECIES: hypothetical protein [unclassified Roseovarius]|uniref:hypothetical protein n=1 Tax=unclassified Roseovarius TaxID=2614913 RepID=UPI00273FF0B4|nr:MULTISPECIES: hypothetical protein [unclassified Roseovarius]
MTKQLTFIASGGRTGTQFFGDMLGQVVSDCHSEHEPDMVAGLSRLTLERVRRFGVWHMGPGRLLGQTGVRVLGQAFLEGRMDRAACATSLRATRDAYHAARPETLIIESYYAWWMVADCLEEIWPGAKLAGILRDPRDWIASWLRHAPKRRNGALTERFPPGPLEPTKLGDEAAAELWPDLDQVGRLAWEWGLIADTLDRAATRSSNVRVFRFEDLFGDEHDWLEQFVDFAVTHDAGPSHRVGDLEAITGDVRNASRGKKQSWQSWNDTQIRAVAQFCGAGMAAHGYGQEPEWQARIEAVQHR